MKVMTTISKLQVQVTQKDSNKNGPHDLLKIKSNKGMCLIMTHPLVFK